ncbi:hypothetical protein [Desulfonatronum parangueonense]
MARQDRLRSAKATGWVSRYSGKNIIKSYARWFAVDLLCAVIELRMLGVSINLEREVQIKATIEARAAEKQRKKAATEAGCEDICADFGQYTDSL